MDLTPEPCCSSGESGRARNGVLDYKRKRARQAASNCHFVGNHQANSWPWTGRPEVIMERQNPFSFTKHPLPRDVLARPLVADACPETARPASGSAPARRVVSRILAPLDRHRARGFQAPMKPPGFQDLRGGETEFATCRGPPASEYASTSAQREQREEGCDTLHASSMTPIAASSPSVCPCDLPEMAQPPTKLISPSYYRLLCHRNCARPQGPDTS